MTVFSFAFGYNVNLLAVIIISAWKMTVISILEDLRRDANQSLETSMDTILILGYKEKQVKTPKNAVTYHKNQWPPMEMI